MVFVYSLMERYAFDLDTKMTLVKKYEGGKKVNTITHDLTLSQFYSADDFKDRERICKATKGSAPMQSAVITK